MNNFIDNLSCFHWTLRALLISLILPLTISRLNLFLKRIDPIQLASRSEWIDPSKIHKRINESQVWPMNRQPSVGQREKNKKISVPEGDLGQVSPDRNPAIPHFARWSRSPSGIRCYFQPSSSLCTHGTTESLDQLQQLDTGPNFKRLTVSTTGVTLASRLLSIRRGQSTIDRSSATNPSEPFFLSFLSASSAPLYSRHSNKLICHFVRRLCFALLIITLYFLFSID